MDLCIHTHTHIHRTHKNILHTHDDTVMHIHVASTCVHTNTQKLTQSPLYTCLLRLLHILLQLWIYNHSYSGWRLGARRAGAGQMLRAYTYWRVMWREMCCYWPLRWVPCERRGVLVYIYIYIYIYIYVCIGHFWCGDTCCYWPLLLVWGYVLLLALAMGAM